MSYSNSQNRWADMPPAPAAVPLQPLHAGVPNTLDGRRDDIADNAGASCTAGQQTSLTGRVGGTERQGTAKTYASAQAHEPTLLGAVPQMGRRDPAKTAAAATAADVKPDEDSCCVSAHALPCT
jgi:hypothetical protein